MVLVTGGTGLVGSHLLFRLAEKGYCPRATFRNEQKTERVRKLFSAYSDKGDRLFNQISWVRHDLEDPFAAGDLVRDCNHVYHCAALISFDPADRKELFAINANGTSYLVDAALKSGVEKFCFTSSVAALGTVEPPFEIDELTLRKNSEDYSGYALSKFKAEMEVWRGVAEGLNAVIVNPSVIIGPSDWHEGLGKIFSLVARRLPFYPKGSTGFVDVRDVASIMITLMEGEARNERFCLNSENKTHREVLDQIAHHLGKRPPAIPLPRFVLSLTWRAEWLRSRLLGQKPLLTRESSRSSANRSFFSNRKIREQLGFAFIPVSQSLADLAAFYKADHPERFQ